MERMDPKIALQHAHSLLSALRDSKLYDDYRMEEGMTDGHYDDMLDVLEALAAEAE